MGDKEKNIRAYLDQKGLQKDLSGYYYLESAISHAIQNPYLNCQGIFENMVKEAKLKCAPTTAYSASVYALKRARHKMGVKRFIRLAADDIVRTTNYDEKEGDKTCH